MKKTKILSLLLCLSLFCALIVPCTKAYAKSDPDSGMKISKTATANGDGSYTITLEAFATGSKVITEQKTDIPTDIVLVLDQSGSMEDPIGGYTYTAYQKDSGWFGSRNYYNEEYYPLRHNGGSENLWHKLPNGSFVSVSVTKTTTYKELNTKLPNYSYWNECYWDYANNLYEKVGDEYKKVELSENKSGDWYNPTYTYTYTFSDGTSISSTGRDSKPNLGSHAPLYTPAADGNDTVYTYTYTDSAGVVQTIGTSTGAETVFSPTLYERVTSTSGGGSKLNALKSAVTSFVNSVNQKALGADGQYGTPDDVAHRIAIVGFASKSRNGNTELLSTEKTTDYWSAGSEHYRDALVPCSEKGNVNPRLSKAINRLDASGDTYLEYGMDMANKIFEQYPITADDTSGRQRVVVVFTDGYPAPSGTNDFKYSMANNAIQNANTTKQTYKATVYTVGVFNTADPTADIETNFATSDGWSDSAWGGSGNNLTEQQEAVAANRYMHYVSSNFPRATSLNQGGGMNSNANPFAGGDSYYLSAGDSASLNNIFQQISNQIETGGSSSTLTSEAVVKDIISPYFTLPAGTTASDIQIDTYACTGKDGNTYTWSDTSDGSGGATATVSGDQVSVTGFDFSENWCGTETNAQGTTTVRGKKLVISFTVDPKSDFLGGNDVITNTSAGIYENGSAQTPVMTFEQPKVNVPIKKVTVTAPEKNVYLKGEVTANQLKDGAKVSVGGVDLDLSQATNIDKPYGLEPWQTKYVDITVTVKDEDGKPISDKLDNLTDDTTYTVEVTVSPKTVGTSTPEKGDAATAKTGFNDPAANIYVFKPKLTFKDSTAYYGDNVPTSNDYSSNRVGEEKWMHGDTASTDTGVTMLGSKPMLNIIYTQEASKLNSGKYTKQDVPVAATVKIGTENINEHTTFVHQDCNPACGWTTPNPNNGNPAFLLHVKTCTLTITKQGGADGEPYVFDICKDNVKYSEVTVKGNGTETLVELPVGTYTIKEDTGWSWRFNPSYSESVILSKDNTSGTITCTNTKNNDQWLNGFSNVEKNVFGVNHNN